MIEGGVKVPTDVRMRDDFYTADIPGKLQRLAFLTKFSQNPEIKRMLWHFVGRGKPNIMFKELMKIRDCIRKFEGKYDLERISKFSSKVVSKMIEK